MNCPICNHKSIAYDVVDFNKSCEEAKGFFLEKSLVPIYYYLCENCHFCFAPTFWKWSTKEFQDKIYNEDYIKVDPEYISIRPKQNAKTLALTFKNIYKDIKHLDYGGGNKLLSDTLKQEGWNSSSYDKMIDTNIDINSLGKFNLISLYEVFEHVPNIDELFKDLNKLISDDGLIIFSTLLNDGSILKNQRLSWWYASPRNGHISLFSKKSLAILAKKFNFRLAHYGLGLHFLYKEKSPIVQTIIK